jgi:hydroxymethylbilane synthase
MQNNQPCSSSIIVASGNAGNKNIITVGSRASSLALIQTEFVVSSLKTIYGCEVDFQIHKMKTKGDKILEKPLPEIGDKGLFTQELEAALLSGQVDFIVHSLKDLPTALPTGCCIGVVLEREDPHDAIVLKNGLTVDSASDVLSGRLNNISDEKVTIGTSSLRRQSQIRRINPNATVLDVRGNLTTRLEKLDGLRGDVAYDALILAKSGLKRAGYGDRISFTLNRSQEDSDDNIDWLYAVGQGALAIECRTHDDKIHDLLRPLTHFKTVYEVLAERSLLLSLEGGCSVPIGVSCQWTSFSDLSMLAAVFSVDGQTKIHCKSSVKLNRSHIPTESDEDREINTQIKKKRRLSLDHRQMPSLLTDDNHNLLAGILIPKDCPVLQSNCELCFAMGKRIADELSKKGAESVLKEIKVEKAKRKQESEERIRLQEKLNTSSSSEPSL